MDRRIFHPKILSFSSCLLSFGGVQIPLCIGDPSGYKLNSRGMISTISEEHGWIETILNSLHIN